MTYETRTRKRSDVPSFFNPLLDALQFLDARMEPLAGLDACEWRDLLRFSDRAHLTLLLSRVPSHVLPDWVLLRIKKNIRDNEQRCERIRALYAEIIPALKRAHAAHIVLKGFTQYPGYVKSAQLRMQSDIDLFCPVHALLPARDALIELGYRANPTPRHVPVDHLPTLVRKTGWEWRGNAFDPEMPLSIELHYCLWNEQAARFGIREMDHFWDRRLTRHVNGFSFPALAPVDQLAFNSLHVLRGLLRGDWVIHHVYELAYFLHTHAHDEAFWTTWQQSHSEHLRSIEAISFSLARTWFNCEVPEEVAEQIDGLVPEIQQWLCHFQSSPLELMFTPNRDGVWLHAALLKSRRAKLAVVRRALLPGRVPSFEPAAQNEAIHRNLVGPRYSNRIASYSRYIVSRTGYYGRVFSRGMWRGACWKLSQQQLGSEFGKFYLASFLWSLGLSMFFFLFNLHLVEHGFSEKNLGWLTSAMAIGSLAGTIPAGKVAKKFGIQKTLLAAFLSGPFLFALRALVFARPLQLALAFLGGAILSVWAVCISPAVAQLTNLRNRPFAFSLIFSTGIGVVSLGNLLGGNLPGWLAHIPHLAGVLQSKQAALLVACSLAAVGALPISRLKFPSALSAGRPTRSTNRFLYRFLPAMAIWGLATGAFSPFATVYFSRYLAMSLPRLGFMFSMAQAMQVMAIIVAPLVFRRYGRIAGIMYTQIAASIALVSLAIVHKPVEAGLLYVGYTAVQWMSEPGMYSMLMDHVPAEERTSASAWNAFVMSSSQAIAAAFAGAAVVRFGYPTLLCITAVIALVAAGAFRVLLSDSRFVLPRVSEGTKSSVDADLQLLER
jgi:MFS family permease